MIIKNIFGNGDNTPKKQASMAKFCAICQEAFDQSKGDNTRLEHCAECITTDKISHSAHWKAKLALQNANSLSPDMAALGKKLAKNRDLVDGFGLKRVAGLYTEPNSIRQVKADQNSETSLEVVRAQVADMLPSVLQEYGLLGKVDADLLVDAIVPTKIASPIMDPVGGRSALRNIVAETVAYFDNQKIASTETPFKSHGTIKKASSVNSILDEGFKRVSSETGYGTRSRTIKATAMPGDPNEMSQNPFAPPQDDNEEDNQSKVEHLPDEEAIKTIHEHGNPEMPDPAMDPMAMGMDPSMMDGQPPMDPNDPMAGGQPPDMLNEGVGTYSGGENMVPTGDEMDEMPGGQSVNRIQSASSDLVARQLKNLRTAKPKAPSDLAYFSFAGKINSLPAQIVKLASQQKAVIDSYQPLNYYTASYSDGTRKTFKCYATDKGAMYVNDDFTIHAIAEDKFLSLIESDPTFKKWAFLPPEVDAEEILGDAQDPDSFEDMALPEGDPMDDGMEGDPGFNDIAETHLNSSPNNSIPGGMAADQEAIFNNGDPGTGGSTLADSEGLNPEDELLDTAHSMMPQIEQMFPDDTPENHMDMAIEAAINLLEGRRVTAEPNWAFPDTTPHDKINNEILNQPLPTNYNKTTPTFPSEAVEPKGNTVVGPGVDQYNPENPKFKYLPNDTDFHDPNTPYEDFNTNDFLENEDAKHKGYEDLMGAKQVPGV